MSALTGKTALVTGGGRGLGRAIAERLGRDGARVGVHYGHDEPAAKETVAAIEAAGGSAFALRAPLGAEGDAEALWAAFDAEAEGVDILVLNAGVTGPRSGVDATSREDFDAIFAVNVRAPFFIVQHGLSRLRDGGRVITVSTGLTHRAGAMADVLPYTMSKGALDQLTTGLAKRLGPRGITVNAVAPGVVDTDMNASWLRGSEEARKATAASSPLGRLGQPADIADVAAFLASDDSRWVTGDWIDATGGVLL
ncbi:SDR family oxidoreductase [Streptomyces radicis]|uniref:SDR family oxidoreductase n=1 Tax=Streptomyces radicis TaxID=1750517 RepID=A0A3A9WFQ3_9ACTN|nr:SDR family oxidoreductase [Streptomyces radicis]RKN06506.1 SDR family oxidoreductase [Streptomyces radicis]RKN20235.1 SDR family oxidoreductase [Streptomyces radicis]